MVRKHKKLLQITVSVLIAALLLWYALDGLNWQSLKNNLIKADLQWLIASFGVMSINFVIRGLRWSILLFTEIESSNLNRVITVSSNMIGYLGNNFLPARAGEVLRCLSMGKHSRISRTFAFSTVAVERIYDTAFLALAGVISLFFIIVALAFASAAPSTPGYIGIYQYVAIEVLPVFNLTKEESLAFILLFQGILYISVIAMGLPSMLWLTNRNVEKEEAI